MIGIEPMDLVMGSVAALVSAAYVCRLDLLHHRTANAVAILLHMAGYSVALATMVWALAGRDPGVAGWCGVALSGAWIAATWRTWRHGMPSWARR